MNMQGPEAQLVTHRLEQRANGLALLMILFVLSKDMATDTIKAVPDCSNGRLRLVWSYLVGSRHGCQAVHTFFFCPSLLFEELSVDMGLCRI